MTALASTEDAWKEALEKGFSVQIVKEGVGELIQAGDHVSLHYEGKLKTTGEIFDCSKWPGNKPINFHVGSTPRPEVIKGLDLGLLKLKLGDEAKLYIKSEHAYGDRGHPPRQFEPYGPGIPPSSDVVFGVTVLSLNGVKDPNAPPAGVSAEAQKKIEDSFLEGLSINPSSGSSSKSKAKKGGKSAKKKKGAKKPQQEANQEIAVEEAK
eukprot:CAMPEP_0172583062 /NCGR_PEP_ID=MMETSP1068-20121228/2641_1 /TAXON_ID=35684 /ORGANISM="Pseudopedinella elastica, Strain CCMP716" /LENGTH=208 /DNA_ID=CAMNT_0013376701 /DNA_START=212 /DNA_END=838 /DNA_ORIENTATION=-